MDTHKVPAELNHEELQRYSRHLLIPEIGPEGQRRLKVSSVAIIGAGGLGSAAAMYLAAAGVGRIGLIDHDTVERSNLQRQVIHGTSNVGERKVDSARKRLQDLNPAVRVDTYDEAFTPRNAVQILEPYDVVLDASDNLATRYLSSDVCMKTGKTNIYGAVYRFEGQVSVFPPGGPCYRCLFPSPPPQGQLACDEGGVFGMLPGTIGTLQATEALKILLRIGKPLTGRLLLYDALQMEFDIAEIERQPRCPVCSQPRESIELMEDGAFYAAGMAKPCQPDTRR